jgi:hypothetical protein
MKALILYTTLLSSAFVADSTSTILCLDARAGVEANAFAPVSRWGHLLFDVTWVMAGMGSFAWALRHKDRLDEPDPVRRLPSRYLHTLVGPWRSAQAHVLLTGALVLPIIKWIAVINNVLIWKTGHGPMDIAEDLFPTMDVSLLAWLVFVALFGVASAVVQISLYRHWKRTGTIFGLRKV